MRGDIDGVRILKVVEMTETMGTQKGKRVLAITDNGLVFELKIAGTDYNGHYSGSPVWNATNCSFPVPVRWGGE